MSLKTENLAIVLTDIVGFTEATAQQSRSQNEQLLASHNSILFPIIKRFKGRLIKTIGDALLIVYRSPTDAMLSAMAMQDALYEYNRNRPEEAQIHIRVAASLGEVRVTRNDIFGEPVNTTSRIEHITPKDEIYFSEAIYMAMNKAEVPCKEVGWKELKGISEPIRIFNIPRFARTRLVPEDIMQTEDISDLVYPYGGAHLSSRSGSQESFSLKLRSREALRKHKALAAAVVLIPVAAALAAYVTSRQAPPAAEAPAAGAEAPPAPVAVAKTVETPAKPPVTGTAVPKPAPAATVVKAAETPAKPVAGKAGPARTAAPKPAPAAASTPSKATSGKKPGVQSAKKAPPAKKPAPAKKTVSAKKTAAPKKTASTRVAKASPPPEPAKPAKPALPPLIYTSIKAAKRDYKRERISKAEYKKAIYAIKRHIKAEVMPHRKEYDAGKISKREYKRRVSRIKKKYR